MPATAPPTELPAIPGKRYFAIGEVADLCLVKPHVLRYWEQEFPQLSRIKRRSNRRYYQQRDLLMIRQIRELLYEQGYTISGARQKLMGNGSARNGLAENGSARNGSAKDIADAEAGNAGAGHEGRPVVGEISAGSGAAQTDVSVDCVSSNRKIPGVSRQLVREIIVELEEIRSALQRS